MANLKRTKVNFLAGRGRGLGCEEGRMKTLFLEMFKAEYEEELNIKII